jgi:capsular polysaccharide biosynthesis protein/Mrp family chromosome partitioning ATPase
MPRGIPEFSDVILACRHHVILCLAMGLTVAVGLAGTTWLIVEPRYRADSFVRVREQQSVIFSPQTTRAEDAAFFRSQANLVQSPQVLAAALAHEAMLPFASQIPESDAIAWLVSRMRVETEAGSELMSISVQHSTAEVAQALANAITECYLSEISTRLESDRKLRRDELQKAVLESDAQLDALWDKRNRVAQAVGSDNSESLTIRDEMQLQAYRDLARQLQTTQLLGNQLQNQLIEHQKRVALEVVEQSSASDASIQQHPELISARKQLADVELQLEQMQGIAASAASPHVVRLVDRRDRHVANIEKITDRIRSEHIVKLAHEQQSQSQSMVEELQRQIEMNRSEKEFLREKLTELSPIATATASVTAVPLDMSRHAIERQSRLADGLWQSLKELEIELQSPSRVALQQWASLPQSASHSRQIRAAGVVSCGGGLLIVLLVGYLEWRDCRVRTPLDITSRTSFPVFGTTSYQSRKYAILKTSRHNSSSSIGIREALSHLFLRGQNRPSAPVVLITSCAAAEPRHVIAQQLAVDLNGYDRRVLLIDCDISSSELTNQLGASHLHGIRQIPSSSQPITRELISELVNTTNHPGFDFLPIGMQISSTSQTIPTGTDPRTIQSVIAHLRSDYDAIFILGPSLMDAAESLLLAEQADSCLMCVFMHLSRWDDFVACQSVACQASIPMAGTILHDGKIGAAKGVCFDQSNRHAVDHLDTESKESELRDEISELKAELEQVRSAGNSDRRIDSDHQTLAAKRLNSSSKVNA